MEFWFLGHFCHFFHHFLVHCDLLSYILFFVVFLQLLTLFLQGKNQQIDAVQESTLFWYFPKQITLKFLKNLIKIMINFPIIQLQNLIGPPNSHSIHIMHQIAYHTVDHWHLIFQIRIIWLFYVLYHLPAEILVG